MIRFLCLCCLFLAPCLLAGGCSTARVELAVAGQPNVNPDYYGRPSPVVVKMYELRNDLAFQQADFRSLFDTPLQVLGADLLAMNELLFVPGKDEILAFIPNLNTRFVGFVAGFRHMERAQWRVAVPVSPEEEKRIALELNDASILIVPEDKAEKWDPKDAIREFRGPERQPGPDAATAATERPAQGKAAASGPSPAGPEQTPSAEAAAASGQGYTPPSIRFIQ